MRACWSTGLTLPARPSTHDRIKVGVRVLKRLLAAHEVLLKAELLLLLALLRRLLVSGGKFLLGTVPCGSQHVVFVTGVLLRAGRASGRCWGLWHGGCRAREHARQGIEAAQQFGAFLRPGLLFILQGFLGGAMSGGQAANAFVDVVRRDWRLGGGVWFVGLYGLWSCRQALLTRRQALVEVLRLRCQQARLFEGLGQRPVPRHYWPACRQGQAWWYTRRCQRFR